MWLNHPLCLTAMFVGQLSFQMSQYLQVTSNINRLLLTQFAMKRIGIDLIHVLVFILLGTTGMVAISLFNVLLSDSSHDYICVFAVMSNNKYHTTNITVCCQ